MVDVSIIVLICQGASDVIVIQATTLLAVDVKVCGGILYFNDSN